MGSALEDRGIRLNTTLWSAKALVDAPEVVRDVHIDYYRAGSDVVTTCTYQASVPGFIKNGYTVEDAVFYMRRAVKLANSARSAFVSDEPQLRERKIALSLGCYGAYLGDGAEYTGDYGGVTQDFIYKFHEDRMRILASESYDVVLFETVPSITELLSIDSLLRTSSCFQGKDVWISCSFRDDSHLADGTSVSTVVDFGSQIENVDAFGLNCTHPHYAPCLVAAIKDRLMESGKRVICYPNRGDCWDAPSKMWVPNSGLRGDDFAQIIGKCLQSGADIVGGKQLSRHVLLSYQYM